MESREAEKESELFEANNVIPTVPSSTENEAAFNFLKAVFGVGILAIPYLSIKAGYIWSVVLLFVIACCCT